MPQYEFHVPPLLLIGEGCHTRTVEALQALGVRRVLVVTDPFLHGLDYTQAILDSLQRAGLAVAIFDAVGREPTTVEVDGALALLRESGADGVLAIGGGSPMDTAKAAAAMATNPGRIVDYMGANKLIAPRLPLVAVPTYRRHRLGGDPLDDHHRPRDHREDADRRLEVGPGRRGG